MNRSMSGLPVHHQLPEFTQTHVHQVHDAIQPSHPQSSPSPPAPNPSQHQSFPRSQLFAWGGQSTGVSALASFPPKKSQGWSPSEWTGWISLQFKRYQGNSSLSHSIVFLCFFALIPEKGFLISPCYSLELAFKWVYLSFSPLFSLPFFSQLFVRPPQTAIAGKNINNLRYADDSTLMAESKEELKSLLLKVKEENEKVVLRLNIQKTEIIASGRFTSWQIDGKQWKQWHILFAGVRAKYWKTTALSRRTFVGKECLCFLICYLVSSYLFFQETSIFYFYGCSHHLQWFWSLKK